VPRLKRPDGVKIHWEARGDGPPVLVACSCFAYPGIFTPLEEELARDHTVITYDARGTGQSTRAGPYAMEVDVADVAAVLEDAADAPAVLIGTGDAVHRVIHVAASRPELVSGVVCPGVAPLGAQGDYGTVGEGLASSTAVVGALQQLLESDYRSGIRTAVEGSNPQLDDDGLRERISAMTEYAPQEATLGRLQLWIDDDARASARALGDRLWILHFPGNRWFPPELHSTVRRESPEANVEEIADGALSRPDLTAEVVRRITHC
jgi:pimeloyl-ACP methyl ester carboxylesterase